MERVKRVKCEGQEEECNSNTTVAVDRISELPDSVVSHILSFVPTVYAVRMSVLSRRWRQMWYSVPTMKFSYTNGFNDMRSFYVFVDKCLLYRCAAITDSVVTSLKLEIGYFPLREGHAVNEWLKSHVILDNVKELDISALEVRDFSHCYVVPCVALNGRYLSVIKLKGVKLDSSSSMNLPSLKSLYLDDVIFDNDVSDTLRDLMIGSPSLEEFVFEDLYSYYGNIKISSSSLKFLKMKAGCKTLEVVALNLQSLLVWYCGQVEFSSCRAIRDLSLFDFSNSTAKNFGDQISNLSHLENLILKISTKFGRFNVKHINISSSTLKCFYLQRLVKQELKIITETPSLVSFKYHGFTGFSLTMKTPNPQLSGSFLIIPFTKKRVMDWYPELINLLSNINCSWNKLSLYSFDDKAFIIPENLRTTCHPLWPNVKHLKVGILDNLTTRKSELRKAMQWLAPSLETLTIEEISCSYYRSFIWG